MILTSDEARAIRSLKRLAKRWPKSLYLFSASGTLLVVHADENSGGLPHTRDGAVDQDYIVDTIEGIPNDGGDF